MISDRQRKRLAKLNEHASAALLRASDYKRTLVEHCEHDARDVEEYRWHHGYGKYVTGLHCMLCGARKSWANMGTWMTAEYYAEHCTGRKDDD